MGILQGQSRVKLDLARVVLTSLIIACAILVVNSGRLSAAENATGIYLLGSKGPQAGMLPPVSGVFGGNTFYVYSGSANPSLTIPEDGNLAIGVDATIIVDAPSVLWVPEGEILGGRLAVFGLLVLGNVDFSAAALLTGPGGVPIAGADTSQSRFSFGDPQVGALIGWNSGNFHWNTGILVNIPIGDYESGALDNLAFNRWAVDLNASATWLDPAIGFELSATAGVTFNSENNDTNYKTGEEFHIEWAVLQHFSKQFSAGLVGYHYQQISGDSGSGATLGAFKGRVTALGAHVGLNVPVFGLPVSLGGRFFVEIDAKNRLKGTAGYLTASFPLSVAQPSQDQP